MKSHPWHEVPVGESVPEVINSIIEIPKSSRAKYELEKESGLLKLDRVIYSSIYYPANYGFIPQTYCDDNDPLDIVVLSQIEFQPLCIVSAKVIGVMRMLDSGEADDKIIAVANNDISVNHINNIEEMPEYFINELQHFFEEYKRLEHKTVVVEEFQSKEIAFEIIDQSIQDYKNKFDKVTN